MPPQSRYQRIVEHIFFEHFQQGATDFYFEREEIATAAGALSFARPKNLGDVIYTYRFRRDLPASIRSKAPDGLPWVIRLAGTARYRFQATSLANIVPSSGRAQTKIPDATPGIIVNYALNDEQALLAKLRYNRLIDIFTGVTCYSLQSHLRTQVKDLGQTETDEIYVGVDKRGAQYVFPVQAKGGRDKLSIVQIEQDFAMCSAKFPAAICRPIGAQFMSRDIIVLLEFEASGVDFVIGSERHYRLVEPKEVTGADLSLYRTRSLVE